jgi:TolA-binding protein
MAKLYETLNESDTAFKLYEEAANANNSDTAARARFRLSELLEAKGDYTGAANSYLRIVILFMHDELTPTALWRAGQCFEKDTNTDQAKKLYQELIRDFPDTEQARNAQTRLAEIG